MSPAASPLILGIAHLGSMPIESIYDHSPMGRDLNATALQALKVDLDTALTFARIAEQDTSDAEKRHRNQTNARKAYDTIVHYTKRLEFTAQERQDIADKLRLLKSALMRLGEAF